MGLKRLLKTEVDDLLAPYVRWHLGMIRRHTRGVFVFDLLVCVALVTAAWEWLGTTAGVVTLIAVLSLYAYGLFRAQRHRRDLV